MQQEFLQQVVCGFASILIYQAQYGFSWQVLRGSVSEVVGLYCLIGCLLGHIGTWIEGE